MIVIVDYGMGNTGSIKKKLNLLGAGSIVSSSHKDIQNADKLILPGVGHFSKAVENIRSLGLWNLLNECVLTNKTPVLGICLGMQLMALSSEEGDAEGFGWFNAYVRKFRISDTSRFKVPHMGWNQVKICKESGLMKGLDNFSNFYFVHSYHIQCNERQDVLNETEYETVFVSAVERDNIFGVQYHPEKSHDAGNIILKNFISL
jgi:imidazole glycerol-phosphate synthase subunit HisH